MNRFYRRRFLNKRGHHGGAFVLADIALERDTFPEGDARTAIYAFLNVADCGRVARLDFFVDDEAGAANALHKARALRDTVGDFTVALESAVAEWRTSSSA